ncbi:MAG: rod-binding protein [Novosphingobium sp.]
MEVSGALPLAPPAASGREKLHKAAQAFEAIFVRQMLSSARAANFGEGLFSSKGTETFQAMQDERFAEIASQNGALGFAKVIEAQLAGRVSPLPLAGGAGGGPVADARTPSPAALAPSLTPPASGRGTFGFASSREGVR